MIPILYDTNEVNFISNGLGRLRDCISAVVTEERNGVYELDFEYPLDGAHADLIKCGRIVGVTHDDSGDIQPFDIVGYERPISGVVTWHCVHISYRLKYSVCVGSNINSMSAAFTLFSNAATPRFPFTYTTDKPQTPAYMACADGLPRTVRQMLGGIEGSMLDTWGGEFEWDRWKVILHRARGRSAGFVIRYGVNLTEFNDSTDYEGTWSACIPYWTNGTDTVIGSKVTSTSVTYTERGECAPLDLSDKFDTQPTAAQLGGMAATYMANNNPMLPAQTINVEFARLSDSPEYAQYQNLYKCRLCDTITVVFPQYNMRGTYKIVKTVYDVLMGRYKELELGTLSVTLAEALGL